MNIHLTLNNNLNYIFIKKNGQKFIIVFTNNNFFKYKISNRLNIYFNRGCKVISLRIPFFCNSTKKTEKFINIYNSSLLNYFIKKIIFSGKSYKIKKKRVFIFEFNKAHMEAVVWKNFFLKKLKKVKILLKNINQNELAIICHKIISIRELNPFTKRGLRMSRSILRKKIGKKSN